MFPDGNSSIARLLVRSLIPGALPGMVPDADPFSIVTAGLDYAQLDQASSPVRLRLSATAVHAESAADGSGVSVSYVKEGEVLGVRGRRCVLACYNNIIPSLCPQLPEPQKAALKQCIKRPLLVVNVALRNGQALQKSGISGAYLPGRLCQNVNLVTGINVADYHPPWNPDDPCIVQLYGAVAAPQPEGLSISQQNQAGSAVLLGMTFEDHEREVRTVMNGIWGASGFDAAEDILAITVNRWPHGYARDHLDLEDSAWNADPPPNVIGRQTFGNIAIANSDAGADAYTHTAIDQAWRAVNELPA
jgi:spermidine dehydrogenase